MRVGEVEPHAQTILHPGEGGERLAVVRGHRATQLRRQVGQRRDADLRQRRRLFVFQQAQANIPTLALGMCDDQPAAFATFDRVRLPVAKALAAIDQNRPLLDADASGDLAANRPSFAGNTASASRSPTTQLHVPRPSTQMLAVHPLIDRLGTDTHRRIMTVIPFQPPGDLLRRPASRQTDTHHFAQRRVIKLVTPVGFTASLTGRAVCRHVVVAAISVDVAGQLPADGRSMSANTAGDLGVGEAGLVHVGDLVTFVRGKLTVRHRRIPWKKEVVGTLNLPQTPRCLFFACRVLRFGIESALYVSPSIWSLPSESPKSLADSYPGYTQLMSFVGDVNEYGSVLTQQQHAKFLGAVEQYRRDINAKSSSIRYQSELRESYYHVQESFYGLASSVDEYQKSLQFEASKGDGLTPFERRMDSFIRGIPGAVAEPFVATADAIANTATAVGPFNIATEWSYTFSNGGLLDRTDKMNAVAAKEGYGWFGRQYISGAYAAADAIGVKSIDDGFHMQGTEYINGNFYSRDMGLLESAGSVATGSLQFVGTGLAGIDGLNAIGSFGKSFLQISTRKVFEAAPSRGVGAADDLVIDSYGILRRRSDIPGQAHHLNQNAAFQSLIPRSEGVSIKLEGNAITGVGTQHYIAHESMESFWDIYRRGGMDAGNLPTISLYNRSLYNGLQEAGLSPEEALRAVRAAKAQQLREGLRGSDFVPRLPNRINQVPRGGN